MAIWAKLGATCWAQSSRYMIVKRTQRKKVQQKRKPGSNSVLFSMKQMFLGRKDQGE